MKNETLEYALAAILGAGLSMAILQAFLLGIAGAIGGLFAKWLISIVKKQLKKNKSS